MAGGMDLGGGGKGGKKPLDASINLTPFIDLMAVTISFLIMTAVWTQIGRLQVSQAGGPSDPQEEEEIKKTIPLTLLITDKDLKLTAGGTQYDPMPLSRTSSGKLELVKLLEKLKEIKTQIPDQTTITLQTEDSVRYEDLVHIIDECIGSGLPQVSVSAAMG
ncbi:MAG: biopolymer transporter ExbD [Myxococcaceae bacterium]